MLEPSREHRGAMPVITPDFTCGLLRHDKAKFASIRMNHMHWLLETSATATMGLTVDSNLGWDLERAEKMLCPT